jgi:hypothetical protein
MKIRDSRNDVLTDEGDVFIDLALPSLFPIHLTSITHFLSIIALNDGKGYAPSKVSALEPSLFSITMVGVP